MRQSHITYHWLTDNNVVRHSHYTDKPLLSPVSCVTFSTWVVTSSRNGVHNQRKRRLLASSDFGAALPSESRLFSPTRWQWRGGAPATSPSLPIDMWPTPMLIYVLHMNSKHWSIILFSVYIPNVLFQWRFVVGSNGDLFIDQIHWPSIKCRTHISWLFIIVYFFLTVFVF